MTVIQIKFSPDTKILKFLPNAWKKFLSRVKYVWVVTFCMFPVPQTVRHAPTTSSSAWFHSALIPVVEMLWKDPNYQQNWHENVFALKWFKALDVVMVAK